MLSHRLQLFLVFLIASVVFCAYFRGLMLDPAHTLPELTGDGLTINYNLRYHAEYGHGATLTSQYHPYEESIFMTDAHALLAVVLATLRPVFPGLEAHAVTIANVLVFWSHPFAVLLLFLILKRLEVKWPLALVFSILIAMISPQVHRQMAGQLTLGFAWLFPLLTLYLLSWDHGRRYWSKSLGVALTVYLLGLNNPYLYAISAALMLAVAGVATVWRIFGGKAIGWLVIFNWLAVFAGTTVALYLTLAWSDTVDDRVAVPFGFFHNTANWGGLISSPGVLWYDELRQSFASLARPRHENQIYLGVVPMLTAIALPFLLLRAAARKHLRLNENPVLVLALIASLFCLLFAFGLPFIWFEYWTYDHLGSILQFRAPARFGWPFYYLLALTAAVGLSRLNETVSRKWLRSVLIGIPILFWGIEAHQFLRGQLSGMQKLNPLSTMELKHYEKISDEYNISTKKYSSIFLLPTELGWTDKIHHNGTFRSNYDGYQLSVASGLPLLNGKLSRMSLVRSLQSQQLTSDPLVRKEIIRQLDTTKDILLLAVKDKVLDPEELRLKRLGEVVHQGKLVTLLRLSPTLLTAETDLARSRVLRDSAVKTSFLRYDWERDADHAFFGRGSKSVGKGWTNLLQIPVDSLPGAGPWRLSGWAFVDGSRFGGPKFYLRMLDGDGRQVVKEREQWINKVYQTQFGWQRVDFTFDVPPEATAVGLIGSYEFPYFLDEFWVWPEGEHAKVETAAGVMYDGFIVR